MKNLIKLSAAVLASFAGALQACWADFGNQTAITLKASGDLSALQYRCLRGDGAGLTNLCSQTAVTSLGGQQYIGVLQNEPRSGEAANVAFAGLSKVVTGEAAVAQMLATHNASGQAINAVSGSVVIGRFIDTTNAAGEVATVLLFPPTRWGAIL